MGWNVTQKLIRSQRAEEAKRAGREIGIYIDQTLTQDATGTLVMLELEANGSGSCPHRRFRTIVNSMGQQLLDSGHAVDGSWYLDHEIRTTGLSLAVSCSA